MSKLLLTLFLSKSLTWIIPQMGKLLDQCARIGKLNLYAPVSGFQAQGGEVTAEGSL